MRKLHKIIFACLLLPLLLAGCGLAPPASPTPGAPTMPPPNTGMLPPHGDEDLLDIWREKIAFRDTKVVFPDKAVNFPVLIVDQMQLDWKALERFVRTSIPDDDILLSEEVSYFKHSLIPDRAAYGERYSGYSLESDVYDTEHGQETARIFENAHGAHYSYQKWFVNMPLEEVDQSTGLPIKKPSGEEEEPEDFGPVRYGEQEAAELVRSVLHEWGVPVEEFEVQAVWTYHKSPFDSALLLQQFRGMHEDYLPMPFENNHEIGEDGKLKRFDLPYGGRGVSIRFRHMLYDIPVFDSVYGELRDYQSINLSDLLDPSDRMYSEQYTALYAQQHIAFRGDWVEAVVSDLGLRELDLSFRRVIEVEKYDVPIRPLRDIVEVHFDTIQAIGPICRVELMLVPTYYSAKFEQTRYRLVPAWCFFGQEIYERVIIDATEGRSIHPADEFWRRWAVE